MTYWQQARRHGRVRHHLTGKLVLPTLTQHVVCLPGPRLYSETPCGGWSRIWPVEHQGVLHHYTVAVS